MDGDERQTLIRSVRQRLESLARAGVDRIALPKSEVAALAPKRRTIKAGPAPLELPTRVPQPAARPAPPVPPVSKPATTTAFSLFEEPPLTASVLGVEERLAALQTLRVEVSGCEKCPHLASTRTQTVFGVGSPTARLMFIGEAPGADEDRLGEPFVGKAGLLLTDMITKGMGLRREDVYIANILKSHPPDNRNPLPDEIAHCLPYLERQIEIVRPEFICILGKVAVSALLQTSLPMKSLRSKWHRYRGIPTIVTWHPAYLLRLPSAKKETWEDLQILMRAMGLKIPERKKGS